MTTKQITLGAMLGAILTVQQIVLAPLHNVSLTAFLVIVFATTLDRKTNFAAITTYLISRNIYFGSPIWIWVLYTLTFGSVSIIISYTKSKTGNIYWASFFGLLLGPMVGIFSAYIWFLFGGLTWGQIPGYLILGIVPDIIHSSSNLIAIGILYHPAVSFMEVNLRMYFGNDRNYNKEQK